MEHGLIRLINSGGTSDEGFTQTIAVSVGNRLYRVTNNGSADGGPGTMRIRIARTVLWFTINSVFDLTAGRSVDVYGSTLSVLALDTLQLFGTYDTI
ncbi:MAG TPA: hypothetical protein VGF59_11170 [Bryobacteraceae bacterium]|jgi:hypothetical protein